MDTSKTSQQENSPGKGKRTVIINHSNMEEIAQAMAMLSKLKENFDNESAENIQITLKRIWDVIVKHTEEAEAQLLEAVNKAGLSQTAAKKIKAIAPSLIDAFETAAYKDPEFAKAGYTLTDLITKGFNKNGEPIKGSPFEEIILKSRQEAIDTAKAAKAAAGDNKELAKMLEQLTNTATVQQVTARPTRKIHYPLDKPNSVIWNMLEAAAKNAGQLRINIDTSKSGSQTPAIVLYGIDFANLDPNLKITAQLTPFDKRVYIAAASLFNGENEIMTVSQIYRQMGNKGSPKSAEVKKINDSLTKMGAARVYLNSEKETAVNKKYPKFKYDAPLLPFERMTAVINGKETDSAIHLLREPPLITFARQRKQITTFERKLLESPVSKTEANLLIDDYLIERISRMKSGKGKTSNKMLYATIYKQCGITTKNQRTRAPEKIRRYLEHYKTCDFIKDYKEDKDGITIIL